MAESMAGWFGLLVAILFGLAVGSFANVAIYRVPLEGLSVFRPARSFCPACGTRLSWFENVPLLSWVFLRGRCRACSVPISWRYPAVELAVAGLFVLLWWAAPVQDGATLGRLFLYWMLAATCVVVSAIDLEHLIIPDVITLPGTLLGVGLSAALPVLHAGHAGFRPESPHTSSMMVALGGMLAGAGSLWLMGWLGNRMLRRQVAEAGVEDAMGMGDVKWMALCGTFLGPLLVLEAILVACFLGAVVGLALKAVARARGGAGPVGLPFGPFLSVAVVLELVWPGAAWNLLQQIGPTA